MAGLQRALAEKNNAVRKLMKLQDTGKCSHSFSSYRYRFNGMCFKITFDTLSEKTFFEESGMDERCEVVEIVPGKDLIFVLNLNGVCSVVSRVTNEFRCYMNLTSYEFVSSVYYNAMTESVITISTTHPDHHKHICRATKLIDVYKGDLKKGKCVFNSDELNWPNLIEFNDLNQIILVCVIQNDSPNVIKVYELKDYTCLCSFDYDAMIGDIKYSMGRMMIVHERDKAGAIRLNIRSFETGEVVHDFEQLVNDEEDLIVELCDNKLLLGQGMGTLRLVDIKHAWNREMNTHTETDYKIFHDSRMFIIISKADISIWDFDGVLVQLFDKDTIRWHEDLKKTMCLNKDENHLICYYKAESEMERNSINVVNIRSGRLVAKLDSSNYNRLEKIKVEEALEDVKVLYYNAALNEIYTGNSKGFLHVWCC